MSQREKAGLSWPGFAVSAGEPDEVVPCASLTWLPNIVCIFAPGLPAASSFADGVRQLLNCTACDKWVIAVRGPLFMFAFIA